MRTVTGFPLIVFALLCSAYSLGHPGGVDAQGCHIDSHTKQRHCHTQRARQSDVGDAEFRPPHPGDEGVFFGPFVADIDGDSLKARIQGVVMEIRLAQIDAPEHDQPYGAAARTELRALTAGKQLTIVFVDVDPYGRVVGEVWVDGLHVNRELVARGAAWFYPKYATNEMLYSVEQDARDAKQGLWALPAKDRTEPWVWREAKRAARPKASG